VTSGAGAAGAPVSAGESPACDPRTTPFYDRSVHAVARDLVGCVLRHGLTAGRVVETESYHESEAACHAFIGETERTRPLLGPPGIAYVYRSYGIHALLNAVAERDGVGAAVLIRALEPLEGIDVMRVRRGLERREQLCSGPGKLTQALAIGLDLNGTTLTGGPIEILPRGPESEPPRLVVGRRIGITKAVELEWRFCDARSAHVSRPWPPAIARDPGPHDSVTQKPSEAPCAPVEPLGAPAEVSDPAPGYAGGPDPE
jgi:DNA-3-methyladenine glycosylase